MAVTIRLARGLYQLPDTPLMAEAVKRVPRGRLPGVRAVLPRTDQLPRAVWMAIGTKDWMPKEGRPEMRIVRFTDALLAECRDRAYRECSREGLRRRQDDATAAGNRQNGSWR